MTRGLAVGVANAWLDSDFSTIFIRLHTGDPGVAGVSNGAAGDTTRQGVTMSAASGGSKSSTGTDPTWTNGGVTETLSDISLHNLAVAGVFKASGALAAPVPWALGNTFTLTTLTISLTPIAA